MARSRIWLGLSGLFVGMLCAEYGAQAQPDNAAPMDAHPRLTENEYRLVAEQNQRRAAERTRRKAARLTALQTELDRAKTEGNVPRALQLERVIARLHSGPPALSEEERWSRAHGRKMTIRGLWHHFGTKLHDPAVVAEFDIHAWRVARLERLRHVAESGESTLEQPHRRVLLLEVQSLLAAESERHEGALDRLIVKTSPPVPYDPQPGQTR